MNIQDYIYHYILPSVAWTAINSLSVTLRIQSIGEERVRTLKQKRLKIIYVAWHGRQFLLPRYMTDHNICIMSSTSRDGILQANILKKFGYSIVYGSSAKSPVRALLGSIKKILAGYDFIFAVDGPTGPIYKVKPGALYLAKKTNAYIVPITFSSHPSIILNAWDKYLLPKPFSKTVIIFGKPFKPSPELGHKILENECLLIEKKLNQITKKADLLVRQPS